MGFKGKSYSRLKSKRQVALRNLRKRHSKESSEVSVETNINDMNEPSTSHSTIPQECKDIPESESTSTFPLKEEYRLNQWLVNIGRPTWLPSTYDRICSLHFEQKYLIYRINKTTMLRENAIPTIFESAIETVDLDEQENNLLDDFQTSNTITNSINTRVRESSIRMLPSTTGPGVWQMGYNMRSRQGTAMTTRGAAAAAGNATSPTELQASTLQSNVPQQNTQNMQQLSPRATVYPITNYTQQELQNARHHMNAAVNINQSRQMSYNPMYTRYPAAPVPAFPVHPDVVFKRLPFFDHLGDLIKPSSLIPSNTPQRIQDQQFTFHLTPTQATEIATNRDVRPNAKLDFLYQVQLRFCLLETSCEQEDFFPPGVTVKVNNKICPLPNPIPTNKQGVEPKRPPKPVNITPLVKLSPTVMNHVQIGWAADYNKGYVIRISMVRKLSAAQLLTRLKSKGVKHADHTTGLIKEKLNEDADCEIATTSLRVSLLCPLGKFRMNVPCRATTCNHLQCFDASVYLEMNERRATWTCPVCDKPALYDNLVIDGYFQEVLNSTKLPMGECDIELHKDGSWQVHVAKKEAPINNTAVNESVEILSDEIEVIPIASSTTSSKPAAPAEPKEEKKMPVVDLTVSDSDDEDDLPLKRKAPANQRPDSTKRRMIDSIMAESENSMEYSDKIIIVEVDVHNRHCSQISTSIATTNNMKHVKTTAERSKEYRIRKKKKTQAASDSIHHEQPKTAAQRMQEYRARKKKETPIANHRKRKKSAAERAKEYRARKKATIQSAENNGSVSSTSSTNNNTRYTGTPGPSNVTSSGYQSPSVITLLDSPSPPPRD